MPMTDHSRKEFLKKLARGSAYVAPVVSTLLTPRSVSAQESQVMVMMDPPPMGGMATRNLPDAPWFKPPPSGR